MRTALLLVDLINPMDFDGGTQLVPHAMQMAGPLLALRKRARRAGVPVIYANDNFGRWLWSPDRITRYCSERRHPGSGFVRRVAPGPRDYFILKAKNSAFFCTSLEPLLDSLRIQSIIITGLSAENCVLFSAHDAYLLGYRVRVPSDCVASKTVEGTARALEQMRASLKADTRASSRLALPAQTGG